MIIALNNESCNLHKWLNNSRKHSMIRVYWLDGFNSYECIKYCANRSIYRNLILFDVNSKCYKSLKWLRKIIGNHKLLTLK